LPDRQRENQQQSQKEQDCRTLDRMPPHQIPVKNPPHNHPACTDAKIALRVSGSFRFTVPLRYAVWD